MHSRPIAGHQIFSRGGVGGGGLHPYPSQGKSTCVMQSSETLPSRGLQSGEVSKTFFLVFENLVKTKNFAFTELENLEKRKPFLLLSLKI